MSLAMQGTWTVSVKSKSAAFPQRFTIAGASTGNGTHVATASTPPVTVAGPHWTIAIEAQDGTVWKPSVMRFKIPTLAGALIKVDIESNDTGADEDFDDLILTCTMPNSASDFVIYGHASAYSGWCWINPCFPLLHPHRQLRPAGAGAAEPDLAPRSRSSIPRLFGRARRTRPTQARCAPSRR